MASTGPTRLAATMALLKGILLLVAGCVALFWPATALLAIVVAGGCLMVADGVLSLASQEYGSERAWPFWLGVTRGVIAVLAGALVLASPYLVSVITVAALALLCGIGAIVVGLIEGVIVIRDRRYYGSIWAPLLAAALYVVLGLVLLFMPMAGAVLVVQFGGAVLIALALVLLIQAWSGVRDAPGTRSRA
jgi:uncharacterized membrane protein HdeD (DUF308 family)